MYYKQNIPIKNILNISKYVIAVTKTFNYNKYNHNFLVKILVLSEWYLTHYSNRKEAFFAKPNYQ